MLSDQMQRYLRAFLVNTEYFAHCCLVWGDNHSPIWGDIRRNRSWYEDPNNDAQAEIVFLLNYTIPVCINDVNGNVVRRLGGKGGREF